jgi:tetratricopeptide (TPR) repeat protein
LPPSRPLVSLLALSLGAAAVAAPTASRERSRVLERLRADLRRAEEALGGGRLDAAAALYSGVAEEALALGRPNLPLARAIDGLADVRRLEGRLPDAAALYAESAALWPDLLGERQPRLATTLHNLGAVHLELGRPGDAAGPLRRALAIFEESFGPGSPQAAGTRALLRRCPGAPSS